MFFIECLVSNREKVLFCLCISVCIPLKRRHLLILQKNTWIKNILEKVRKSSKIDDDGTKMKKNL